MQIKLTNLAKELMAGGIKDHANPEQYATFKPLQGTPASAGYDLRACIEEPINIGFGETVIIPCGFHLHIADPNIVGKLYVRSSVGTELGLVLANGTGIIDSDYQDEWKLAIRCTRRSKPYKIFVRFLNKVLENFVAIPVQFHGSRKLLSSFISVASSLLETEDCEDFVTVYPAQRLAQVVFIPIEHPNFYMIEDFTQGSSRFGGFGSTDRIAILPTDGKEYGG